MTSKDLTVQLTELRDEAHRLSQEKLASGEADQARLARANELQRELERLKAENETAAGASMDQNSDIAQVARRYLIFLLTETSEPTPTDLSQRARSLHDDIITAAKLVAAGSLQGAELKRRTAELSASFEAIIEDPARDQMDIASLLGDLDLDLEYLFQEGNAPTSLRLAGELRP